MIRRDARLP